VKRFFRGQGTFILFGLAFWLPVVVTIFILSILVSNAESLGDKFLGLFLPESHIYPGFGVALAIIIIYVSGMILKLTRITKIFSKIPVIGLFFGAGEIVTVDRLLHMQPCLFLISPTCISYGWILSEEQIRVGNEPAGFQLINVYFPNVPSLVTGQVYPVRKDTVIKLGNPSKDVIDLLLYAFRSPKDLKYLPWEDECQEDFIKRARSFGLYINSNRNSQE
jgi:uncharacterized membrane protein